MMIIPHPSRTPISIALALWRGFRRRCPNCGVGSYRDGYLQVTQTCAVCGETLGHIRADDGPAYFTLFIAVHLSVGVALWVEKGWAPPMEAFIPAAMIGAAILIWALLPSVKGAMVAFMWRLRLNGNERYDDIV